MRQREDRIPVSLEARMRTEAGWTDIVIRNVSPRGMLVKAETPPPAGAYVEIRCARLAVVGRAVWAKRNMIGIRLQDRLQMDALLGSVAKMPAASLAGPHTHATRFLAGIADRSRDRARQLQYLAMLLVLALAAAAIADTVATTLAAPFDAVRDGMGHP